MASVSSAEISRDLALTLDYPPPHSKKSQIIWIATGVLSTLVGLGLTAGLFAHYGYPTFAIAGGSVIVGGALIYLGAKMQTRNFLSPQEKFESIRQRYLDVLTDIEKDEHRLWHQILSQEEIDALKEFSFDEDSMCFKIDSFPCDRSAHDVAALYDRIDLSENATLDTAEVLFLNESNHADEEMQKKQNTIPFLLGNAGDIGLLESIPNMKKARFPENHWISQKELVMLGWDEEKWTGREEDYAFNLGALYAKIQSTSLNLGQKGFLLRRILSLLQELNGRRAYRTQIRNRTLFATIHALRQTHPNKKIFIFCGRAHGQKKEVAAALGTIPYAILYPKSGISNQKRIIQYYLSGGDTAPVS